MKRILLTLTVLTLLLAGCGHRRVVPTAAPSPVRPEVAAPTAPDAARRVYVFVTGKVQNVGFRAFIEAEAKKLALTGWDRNLADERVEAVVEGPNRKVKLLVETIRVGPPRARVDKVEVADEQPTGEFKDFQARWQ